LLGVLREPGEAPMALMATHDAERRYVGSAIIALNREMRDRRKRSRPQPHKISTMSAKISSWILS
jgi:hypothetical protein